jgi:DNA-binding transcriptional LysR family regulator
MVMGGRLLASVWVTIPTRAATIAPLSGKEMPIFGILMRPTDRFDIDALLILAKVAELKSLSRAGEVLGVPRSTVSRKLDKLERDIGVKLVRRNTRQLSMTEFGQRVAAHAARIQAEVDGIRAELTVTREAPEGMLRVALPVFMGVEFAARVGSRFLERFPKARLETKLVDVAAHPIKDGFDVTLDYGPLQDSALIGRKLFAFESVLCAAPAYLVGLKKQPAEPQQLSTHPFIDVSDGDGRVTIRLRKGRRSAEIDATARAQANNYQIGKQYVLQGVGVGALPRHICSQELQRGELVALFPEWTLATRDVYVIYPFKMGQSLLIQAFFETAQEIIERTKAEGGR